MRKNLLVLVLALSACTTARIEPDLNRFAQEVDAAAKSLKPVLTSGLAKDAEERLTFGADNQETWFLSDACADALAVRAATPVGRCQIERVPTTDKLPPVGNATAAAVNISALQDYVAALALLASATSETELIAAYGAALGGLENIGAELGGGGLADFVKGLEDRSAQTESVVDFAIKTLRFQRMREVVLDADPAVQTAARNLQLQLMQMHADPTFDRLAKRLGDADNAVLEADTSDGPAYRAALVELQNAHVAFVAHYARSIYVSVAMIGKAHGGLAGALRNPGKPEEIVDYITALKALSDSLKE